MKHFWKYQYRNAIAVLALAGLQALPVAAEDVANFGSFADQTIALLGQPDYGFTSDETILVSGYFDAENPAVVKLDGLGRRGAGLFDALGDYSVEIAGLGGQQISEQDRVARLGTYLESLKPRVTATIDFTDSKYDAMVAEVNAQETFLAAIRKVQPLVNAAGRQGQVLITEYENGIYELARVLDAAIQEDFAVMLTYMEALEKRHGETLLEVVELADSESPSTREAKELKARLDRMQKIFNFIGPRWDLYKLTLEELNTLQTKAIANTGRERVALLLWVRAHQRMASGMGSSSWFNYGGLIKDELGL